MYYLQRVVWVLRAILCSIWCWVWEKNAVKAEGVDRSKTVKNTECHTRRRDYPVVDGGGTEQSFKSRDDIFGLDS